MKKGILGGRNQTKNLTKSKSKKSFFISTCLPKKNAQNNIFKLRKTKFNNNLLINCYLLEILWGGSFILIRKSSVN